MGQAKARGTFEQRKAQAVERQRVESERRSAEHRSLMKLQAEKRAERIRKLPPEQRKVAIMDASPKHSALMLMAAAAALSMPIIEIKRRKA